jgi:hypothetical protein
MPLPPIPWRSPLIQSIADRLIGRDAWAQWFLAVQRAVDSTALGVGTPQTLIAQHAALPVTTVLTVPATGLYRVSVAAVITQAATTSSSLQLTVRWTCLGVPTAVSGAAMTTNVVGTLAQITPIAYADEGTVITVEAAYASVGATSMQYTLSARVEAMS